MDGYIYIFIRQPNNSASATESIPCHALSGVEIESYVPSPLTSSLILCIKYRLVSVTAAVATQPVFAFSRSAVTASHW
jgi:hypothetical protein